MLRSPTQCQPHASTVVLSQLPAQGHHGQCSVRYLLIDPRLLLWSQLLCPHEAAFSQKAVLFARAANHPSLNKEDVVLLGSDTASSQGLCASASVTLSVSLTVSLYCYVHLSGHCVCPSFPVSSCLSHLLSCMHTCTRRPACTHSHTQSEVHVSPASSCLPDLT